MRHSPGGRFVTGMFVTGVAVTVLTTGVLLSATAASAELYNPELVCRPEAPQLSPHELLRALSFDLRGAPPSMAEYAAVSELGAIPENLVDEWLDTEAFRDQVVRFHRAMFWNELSNLSLGANRLRLRKSGGIYWRRDQANDYRGGSTRPMCLDEPAEYDDDGNLVFEYSTDTNGTEIRREGWVEVAPYWAPETVVKICALDAQDALVGLEGEDCATSNGFKDDGCGCGPDLRWCMPDAVKNTILNAFERDVDHRVEWMLDGDLPYDALLTDAPAFVNGPIAHYLRYQAGFGGSLDFSPAPIPVVQLPTLDYTATNTWVEVELSDSHAGALSAPGFLLRFQTNRSRASKFSTDFLCDPFVAPSGGLPPATDAEALEIDLQKRAGCKYCHARLEPAASYWGRYPESGAGLLGKAGYPAFSAACEACALKTGPCPSECSEYVTKATAESETPYFGWLKATTFLKADHMTFIDEGPRAFVKRSIVDHKLPSCITRKTASWLFGRGLHAEESAWLDEVSQHFVVSGLHYRDLVRALVNSPMYGAVR